MGDRRNLLGDRPTWYVRVTMKDVELRLDSAIGKPVPPAVQDVLWRTVREIDAILRETTHG